MILKVLILESSEMNEYVHGTFYLISLYIFKITNLKTNFQLKNWGFGVLGFWGSGGVVGSGEINSESLPKS